MTADEIDPANRLTIAYDTGTIKRWHAMVRLYSHLLSTECSLPVEIRAELQRRLAHCHWRLSRLEWKSGSKLTSFRSMLTSLRIDATVAPSIVRDAVGRRFAQS